MLMESPMELDILKGITSPRELKALDSEALFKLASEIRKVLIKTVSENGGHLASNLGIVETTIALHRVFNTPDDKIVFDVGHQSYVHKLLTGRYEEFRTLRKEGGISGFPKREESKYDSFNTGHASTSLSAAFGMLRANRLLGRNDNVVAVIGDGALTGGMAYEAMNDIGQSKLPLIVVLNDNNMAISSSVGALSHLLNGMRTSIRYQLFKQHTIKHLHRTRFGRFTAVHLERMKNRIKYFLLPNNIFFESLGLMYIGPIDGHDIDAVSSAFGRAMRMDRPVIVHVITQKGKGYAPAEQDPEKFHGIAPFDMATGMVKKNTSGQKSNSEVFGEGLLEIADSDERVCVITAAMASGTGVKPFFAKYPHRAFDVGIAEEHAVTLAAGMAAEGLRPVVAIYSTFLQRAYDQILHDVCLQKLPIVFAVDRAGLVGEDGETHQGAYDIAYLMSLPQMTILSPASQTELLYMLRYAVKLEAPVAIRYNRGALPVEIDGFKEITDVSWQKLDGLFDVNVIATGRMVDIARKALLGLRVGLINARVLKPFDEDLLSVVLERSKVVVTIEDGIIMGGFGAAIARLCAERGKRAICIGLPDTPVAAASVMQQLRSCGMDEEGIRNRIRKVLYEIGSD